jgi:hypothetical protein
MPFWPLWRWHRRRMMTGRLLRNGRISKPASAPHSALSSLGEQYPPKASQATQRPSDDSGEPNHIYIPEGTSGLKIGSWVTLARAAMDGQPEDFRRAWLEEHQTEIDEVRRLRPEWADKLEAQAIAPDLAEAAE